MKLLIALLRNQIGDIDGSPIGTEMLCEHLSAKEVDFDILCGKSFVHNKFKIVNYLERSWRDKDLLQNTYHFIRKVNSIKNNYSHLYIVLPNPAFSVVADLISHNNKTVRFESSVHKIEFPKWGLSKSYLYYLMSYLVNSRLLCAISKNSADKYLVSTRFQKDELRGLGFSSKSIHISMNPSLIMDKNGSSRGINRNLFVYAGHANYVKGLDVLIRAVHIATKEKGFKDIKIELAIAADYFHHAEIEHLVKKLKLERNIVFKRIVSINKLLQSARAIVLPYRHSFGTQILPNIILESIQLKTPIITTKTEALSEFLTDEKDSVLVKPDDPEELADAMVRITNDDKLCSTIKTGMEKLNKIADPENASEKILSCILN